MDSDAAETSADVLTSTMGSVLSGSGEPAEPAVDSVPSSSSDANNADTTIGDETIDDPISSTSDEVDKVEINEGGRGSADIAMGERSKKTVLKSDIDNEADLFANECNLSDISPEKITENVEDIVTDLENLLGTTPQNFSMPTGKGCAELEDDELFKSFEDDAPITGKQDSDKAHAEKSTEDILKKDVISKSNVENVEVEDNNVSDSKKMSSDETKTKVVTDCDTKDANATKSGTSETAQITKDDSCSQDINTVDSEVSQVFENVTSDVIKSVTKPLCSEIDDVSKDINNKITPETTVEEKSEYVAETTSNEAVDVTKSPHDSDKTKSINDTIDAIKVSADGMKVDDQKCDSSDETKVVSKTNIKDVSKFEDNDTFLNKKIVAECVSDETKTLVDCKSEQTITVTDVCTVDNVKGVCSKTNKTEEDVGVCKTAGIVKDTNIVIPFVCQITSDLDKHADITSDLLMTTDSSNISDVSKATDVSKINVVSITEATDLSEISDVSKGTDITNTTDLSKINDLSKGTNITKTTDLSQTSNSSITTDLSNTIGTLQAVEITATNDNISKVINITKTSDNPHASDISKATDITITSNISKTTDVSTATKILESSTETKNICFADKVTTNKGEEVSSKSDKLEMSEKSQLIKDTELQQLVSDEIKEQENVDTKKLTEDIPHTVSSNEVVNKQSAVLSTPDITISDVDDCKAQATTIDSADVDVKAHSSEFIEIGQSPEKPITEMHIHEIVEVKTLEAKSAEIFEIEAADSKTLQLESAKAPEMVEANTLGEIDCKKRVESKIMEKVDSKPLEIAVLNPPAMVDSKTPIIIDSETKEMTESYTNIVETQQTSQEKDSVETDESVDNAVVADVVSHSDELTENVQVDELVPSESNDESLSESQQIEEESNPTTIIISTDSDKTAESDGNSKEETYMVSVEEEESNPLQIIVSSDTEKMAESDTENNTPPSLQSEHEKTTSTQSELENTTSIQPALENTTAVQSELDNTSSAQSDPTSVSSELDSASSANDNSTSAHSEITNPPSVRSEINYPALENDNATSAHSDFDNTISAQSEVEIENPISVQSEIVKLTSRDIENDNSTDINPTSVKSEDKQIEIEKPTMVQSETDEPISLQSKSDNDNSTDDGNPTAMLSNVDEQIENDNSTDEPVSGQSKPDNDNSTIDSNPTTMLSNVDEQMEIENPPSVQSEIDNTILDQSEIENPASVQSEIQNPASVQSEIEIPTSIQSEIETPILAQSEIEKPTLIQSEIENPTLVQSEIDKHTSVQSESENDNSSSSHSNIDKNLSSLGSEVDTIEKATNKSNIGKPSSEQPESGSTSSHSESGTTSAHPKIDSNVTLDVDMQQEIKKPTSDKSELQNNNSTSACTSVADQQQAIENATFVLTKNDKSTAVLDKKDDSHAEIVSTSAVLESASVNEDDTIQDSSSSAERIEDSDEMTHDGGGLEILKDISSGSDGAMLQDVVGATSFKSISKITKSSLLDVIDISEDTIQDTGDLKIKTVGSKIDMIEENSKTVKEPAVINIVKQSTKQPAQTEITEVGITKTIEHVTKVDSNITVLTKVVTDTKDVINISEDTVQDTEDLKIDTAIGVIEQSAKDVEQLKVTEIDSVGEITETAEVENNSNVVKIDTISKISKDIMEVATGVTEVVDTAAVVEGVALVEAVTEVKTATVVEAVSVVDSATVLETGELVEATKVIKATETVMAPEVVGASEKAKVTKVVDAALNVIATDLYKTAEKTTEVIGVAEDVDADMKDIATDIIETPQSFKAAEVIKTVEVIKAAEIAKATEVVAPADEVIAIGEVDASMKVKATDLIESAQSLKADEEIETAKIIKAAEKVKSTEVVEAAEEVIAIEEVDNMNVIATDLIESAKNFKASEAIKADKKVIATKVVEAAEKVTASEVIEPAEKVKASGVIKTSDLVEAAASKKSTQTQNDSLENLEVSCIIKNKELGENQAAVNSSQDATQNEQITMDVTQDEQMPMEDKQSNIEATKSIQNVQSEETKPSSHSVNDEPSVVVEQATNKIENQPKNLETKPVDISNKIESASNKENQASSKIIDDEDVALLEPTKDTIELKSENLQQSASTDLLQCAKDTDLLQSAKDTDLLQSAKDTDLLQSTEGTELQKTADNTELLQSSKDTILQSKDEDISNEIKAPEKTRNVESVDKVTKSTKEQTGIIKTEVLSGDKILKTDSEKGSDEASKKLESTQKTDELKVIKKTEIVNETINKPVASTSKAGKHLNLIMDSISASTEKETYDLTPYKRVIESDLANQVSGDELKWIMKNVFPTEDTEVVGECDKPIATQENIVHEVISLDIDKSEGDVAKQVQTNENIGVEVTKLDKVDQQLSTKTAKEQEVSEVISTDVDKAVGKRIETVCADEVLTETDKTEVGASEPKPKKSSICGDVPANVDKTEVGNQIPTKTNIEAAVILTETDKTEVGVSKQIATKSSIEKVGDEMSLTKTTKKEKDAEVVSGNLNETEVEAATLLTSNESGADVLTVTGKTDVGASELNPAQSSVCSEVISTNVDKTEVGKQIPAKPTQEKHVKTNVDVSKQISTTTIGDDSKEIVAKSTEIINKKVKSDSDSQEDVSKVALKSRQPVDILKEVCNLKTSKDKSKDVVKSVEKKVHHEVVASTSVESKSKPKTVVIDSSLQTKAKKLDETNLLGREMPVTKTAAGDKVVCKTIKNIDADKVDQVATVDSSKRKRNDADIEESTSTALQKKIKHADIASGEENVIAVKVAIKSDINADHKVDSSIGKAIKTIVVQAELSREEHVEEMKAQEITVSSKSTEQKAANKMKKSGIKPVKTCVDKMLDSDITTDENLKKKLEIVDKVQNIEDNVKTDEKMEDTTTKIDDINVDKEDSQVKMMQEDVTSTDKVKTVPTKDTNSADLKLSLVKDSRKKDASLKSDVQTLENTNITPQQASPNTSTSEVKKTVKEISSKPSKSAFVSKKVQNKSIKNKTPNVESDSSKLTPTKKPQGTIRSTRLRNNKTIVEKTNTNIKKITKKQVSTEPDNVIAEATNVLQHQEISESSDPEVVGPETIEMVEDEVDEMPADNDEEALVKAALEASCEEDKSSEDLSVSSNTVNEEAELKEAAKREEAAKEELTLIQAAQESQNRKPEEVVVASKSRNVIQPSTEASTNRRSLRSSQSKYQKALTVDVQSPSTPEVSVVKEAESTTNEEMEKPDQKPKYSSKISQDQELKLTIRKNKSEEPVSILKIYDPKNPIEISPSESETEPEELPITQFTIMKQSPNSPKLMSPLKITIKPVLKPEDIQPQKSSPKLIIKPIVKPDDESGERHHSPKITIKPIVKPSEEADRCNSPKITIKPLVKPPEASTSPKIKIKPIVKPDEQKEDKPPTEIEEETKERIVLKINKSNIPPIEEVEKLGKITVKLTREGRRAHIVNKDSPEREPSRSPHKRAHPDDTESDSKKLKLDEQSIPIVTPEPEPPTNAVADKSKSNKNPLDSTNTPKSSSKPGRKKIEATPPVAVAPRKRGRPRKVPLEVREEFKEEELEPEQPKEPEPVGSGRPKRSCRGPSVRTTLGIKPRKPRERGGGRGGRGRGRGGRVEKAPKKERISDSKLKLIKEAAITAKITESLEQQDVDMKLNESETILIEDSSDEKKDYNIKAELLDESIANKSADIVMYEEETRMSAETSSRAQTPAKQVLTTVVSDVVEESQSSVQSTATSESVKVRKGPRMEIETEGPVISPDQLAEYYWGGGGPYMLQEQVAQFLGIKSFKRKYPGIQRRMVDMQERDFIRESGLASESMCDLGLTAVSSADILDIMYSDFQYKYEEYCKHQRDRQTKEITNKQKALAAFQDKNKLDMMQQAIESASQWNASFNKTRKEERKACMDLQTFTINFPKGKMKQIPKPKIGHYPIALVPGQYTDYYKTYTPTEINNLPLNTMLYNPIKINNEEDSHSDGSGSETDSSSSGSDSSDSDSSDDDCNICSPTPSPQKKAAV